MTTERAYLPAMAKHSLLPFYDVFSRLLGAKDVQWQLVAQAGIEPGATVLEIGCGTGNVLMLAKRAAPGATVIGLDPDPKALATARRKAARAGVEVRLDRGYADELPYADGSVDRVLSSFMFHHVPDDQQLDALREVRRVLAPGGRLDLVDVDQREFTSLSRRVLRGHDHGVPLAALMAEAGFADVVEIGRGKVFVGGYARYRALR